MPMIVPAIASAVTWVSAASAATIGFLAAPMVMALGEGLAIAVATTALKFTATALGSLALNAILAPKVGSAGSPTSFKADPSSPIRGVMGRFGTGGNQNHFRVWGKDNLMISFSVILSLGPIQGIDKFEANNLQVTFPGPNGASAPVEPYRDKMWMTYKMGLPTDGALGPPPVGGTPAMEWTANHKTSGYAGAFWTMQNNSKKASFEGGVPKPMWTVLGQKLYDPRKDSTQVSIGGSGTHRLDDWRTWEYTQNPQIHALNWILGHHKKLTAGIVDRSKMLAGVGAPISKVDLPTFVAAANVSDINGWTISGEWNTQDGKWQTFAAMLQAGSSVPVQVGAKIGIMVNAPRVAVANITGADIIGNMNLKVMASRRDRFNTVFPRYINENQNWEYATAGAVSDDIYVTQDNGQERPKELTYNYVSDPKQAGQLAAYDLANTRETLKVAFPAKPHLLGVKPGDAVTVTSVEHGLSMQKFIVTARPIEIMEGTIAFELRSETDSKHPWALGQTSQPAPSPGLLPFDPTPTTPGADEWQITPRPADPDGSQQPGFILVGTVPDGIGSVLFETAPAPAGPWTTSYSGPPTTQTVRINGLIPGAQYYVGVTYISVKGLPSERRIWGPYTAPDLISTSTTKFPDGSSPVWNYDTAADLPVPPDDDSNLAFVMDEEKLYTWNASTNSWEKTIDGADIDPGTLENNAFVAGLQAPGLGSVRPSLPDPKWPEGSMFVDITDGKTYTNRGGVWSAAIAASDIVGVVPSGIPFGPTNPATGTPDVLFHNTTDGKLYRWNSPGGWTTAADGADLIANSITTNKIAVGSITTALLGANAVTASKMFVGDTSNIFVDPTMSDISLWSAGELIAQTAGVTSANKLRLRVAAGAAGVDSSSASFPVEAGKNYSATAYCEASGASTGARFRLYFYTNAGAYIDGVTVSIAGNTARQQYFISATAPTNASSARIIFSHLGAPASVADLIADSVVVRRPASGELIVDGAVTADKVAANAIVAGKIAAGAVTANTIAAQSITASKMFIGDTSNMFPDPNLTDNDVWGTVPDQVIPSGLVMASTNIVRITTSATAKTLQTAGPSTMPVEAGIPYFVSTKAYVNVNDSEARFYVRFFSDTAGTTFLSDVLIGTAGTTTLQTLSGQVVAPATARRMAFRYYRLGGGTGTANFGEPIARRATNTELVVNGSIIADKIASNAITADKILAGAVTAGKINVTNLAAINADMGIITAGIIRSGTTGIRTEIRPSGGTTYHANGQIAVEWGVFA